VRDGLACKGYRNSRVSLFSLVFPLACLPFAVAVSQTGYAPRASLQGAGPEKTWSFDTVSVKPNKSGTDGVYISVRSEEYSGENLRIIDLVSQAYGIKQDLISGMPGWADGAHFDVKAKLTPQDAEAFEKLSREEKIAANKALLRSILEERFHLKTHIETKQLPVYNLVLAKGGLKMKAVGEDDTFPKRVNGPDGRPVRGLVRMQDGMFIDQGIEISGLVNQLANMVHRTVIDKTALKGRFDLALKYAPDRDAPPDANNGSSQDDAPSIFAALEEQLGLKLQSDKGPVDTLLIDHVERPTQN